MAESIKKIIDDVKRYKKVGHKKIKVTDLLIYLNNEIKEEAVNSQFNKLKYQRRLAIYTEKLASKREMFNAIITFGVNALRSLFLLNGGAAIAVLAFMGNIWTKPDRISPPNLLYALICFSIGLMLSVGCSGASYVSQGYYCCNVKMGQVWRFRAIIIGLVCLLFFGIGVFFAYIAFSSKTV